VSRSAELTPARGTQLQHATRPTRARYCSVLGAGPGLAAEIADGVADLLRKDCFADVSEAVGIDVRNSVTKRPMA